VHDAQLVQHRGPIVVDPLARELVVIFLEVVDRADRERYPAPRRQQPAPRPFVGAAYLTLEDDRLLGGVASTDVYEQVWGGPKELLVVPSDRLMADVVLAPGLLVVVGARRKGPHHGVEVVGVLVADVFLDPRDPCLKQRLMRTRLHSASS